MQTKGTTNPSTINKIENKIVSEKEQELTTAISSKYCIQLKEILSNSWQGFFKSPEFGGLEFETQMQGGKEITIMRGTFRNQEEFQKVLQQLEEMNLHYQKVTVDIINSNTDTDNLPQHIWIHEAST